MFYNLYACGMLSNWHTNIQENGGRDYPSEIIIIILDAQRIHLRSCPIAYLIQGPISSKSSAVMAPRLDRLFDIYYQFNAGSDEPIFETKASRSLAHITCVMAAYSQVRTALAVRLSLINHFIVIPQTISTPALSNSQKHKHIQATTFRPTCDISWLDFHTALELISSNIPYTPYNSMLPHSSKNVTIYRGYARVIRE